MHLKLDKLYSAYKKGELGRGEFEGLVYSYLVQNQDKTCISHWKHDEYEDFISWFYTRLQTAIDSYVDTGSSFDAFLARYLLVSSKEYHVRTITNSVIEYSAWSARIPEMYAHEEPPVYFNKEPNNEMTRLLIDRSGRKSPRRVLALILKCYYYVSDDFAEKIAPMIGMSSGELTAKLNMVREIRQKKDDKIFQMKERIYRQFYRCIVYEKRLLLTKENTAAYEKLKRRSEKAKQRLDKMREQKAKIRTEATNREIAGVIGVSKGCVDASLCRLKTKWEKMAQKAILN